MGKLRTTEGKHFLTLLFGGLLLVGVVGIAGGAFDRHDRYDGLDTDAVFGVAQAQAMRSNGTIDETVILKQNGQILIDNQRTSAAKYDILADKYVWRYKVVDAPGEILQRVTVKVLLPPGVSVNQVKPTIFAVHGVDETYVQNIDDKSVNFVAVGVGPDSSLTLTLDLPTTAIQFSSWQRLSVVAKTLSISQWLTIALLVPGLLLFTMIFLFVTRAGDILLRPSAEPHARPPSQLPPALVGVLINGYVGVREISATLIDLARRGYVDIIYRGENDFAFSQKRDWRRDKQLQDFERFFLDQLFVAAKDKSVAKAAGPISSAKDIDLHLNQQVWSETISQAIDRIYLQMTELGYFVHSPKHFHMVLRFIGIIIFFISVIGLAFSLYFFTDQPLAALPWLVTLVVSPIITRLALIVPRRTKAGREQAAAWLAFRATLGVGTRVPFSDETDLYENYLAYAIVLSVEGAWTGRFASMACRLPNWFFSSGTLINSYPELADALFRIIGFVGNKFSFSRRPTAL